MFLVPIDIIIAMFNPMGVSALLVIFPLFIFVSIIALRWLFFGQKNLKDVLAGD
jgi:hypothetical protein